MGGTRVALCAVVCALAGACADDSRPPLRASAALEPSIDQRSGGIFAVDVRDDDPAWVAPADDRSTEVLDRTGAITPPLAGVFSELVISLRALPGPIVWMCTFSEIAVFDGSSWRTFDPEEVFGREAVACLDIDARSATDAWVTSGGRVCHFDGAAWECSDTSTFAIALTQNFVFTSEVGLPFGEGGMHRSYTLGAENTSDPAAERQTYLLPEQGARIMAVPNSDRVFVDGSATLYAGSIAASALFGPEGEIEVFEDARRQLTLPISSTEYDVLELEVHQDDGRCRGPCWTQYVLYHVEDGARTEVAHIELGPGTYEAYALRAGSERWIRVRNLEDYECTSDCGTWYRVP
jgi:hypothetical protein